MGFCVNVARGGRSPLSRGSDASRGCEHVSLCLGGNGNYCGRGCLPGELARPLFRVLHARRSRLRAGITVSRANRRKGNERLS